MIRKFAADFATFGLGDFIVKISMFVTLPIYTRYLSTSEYGAWNLLITGVGLLGAFLILGGDSAYSRLFLSAKNLDEQQVITSTWFSFLALWSLAVVFLCVLFSRPIATWVLDQPGMASLVVLALIAAPVSLMNAMCAQALRNLFLAREFAFWNIVAALLSITFSLTGIVLLHLGVAGILGGALVAGIIMLPIRLWTIRSLLRPRFSFDLLKQLLGYGVPLVPVSLAYWVFASSDRLILERFTNLEQVGLYAVANQITGMIGFLYGALGQAWAPRAILFYESQPEAAQRVFGQMLTYFLVFFGILCVGVGTFAYEIIALLSTQNYLPAAPAVGPLALAYVAYASTQVTALSISLTRKTIYFSIFAWLSAGLNVLLNLIFVPQFGMVAAAWSTAAAYLFLTLSYLVVSQRLWRISYETRRTGIVIALTLAFTIAAPLLPQLGLIGSLILKGAYCLVFVVLLALFGVIDQREWEAVSGILRQLRTRVV